MDKAIRSLLNEKTRKLPKGPLIQPLVILDLNFKFSLVNIERYNSGLNFRFDIFHVGYLIETEMKIRDYLSLI